DARLSDDGDTSVSVKGKEFRSVSGSRILHAGDRVRVDGGSARIALSDGGKLELRKGSALRFAGVPFVEAGDVLVEPSRQPTEVTTDGATVRVLDGAAHLSRTLAFAVTVYRGTSTISSPGSAPLAVRAPRQGTPP